MMQLTTSKRISLMFTLYTMCIVFFFGVVINIFFFQQRYQAENVKLQVAQRVDPGMGNRRPPRFAPAPVQTIVFNYALAEELTENTIVRRLSSIDDEYVIYFRDGNTIKITVVSHLVQAQRQLIKLFLMLMIVFAFVTYGFSLLFVRSSLRNIKNLVDYVDALDIHSLDTPVPLQWPEDDEIRKIWQALQDTLYTIKEQTDALRDFVTHASHELKTPLMSLSATMDAAHKTGKYANYIPKLKANIASINTLFDTLLSITKREYHGIQSSSVDIVPIIQAMVSTLQGVYIDKHITCQLNLPREMIVSSHPDICHIVFHNIIQNAYKYTPVNGKIMIVLKDNVLTVSDSWPWIAQKDRVKIRQKFWKNHTDGENTQWFGLGLYLVQLLVKKQWRKISVSAGEKSGSVFTLKLN